MENMRLDDSKWNKGRVKTIECLIIITTVGLKVQRHRYSKQKGNAQFLLNIFYELLKEFLKVHQWGKTEEHYVHLDIFSEEKHREPLLKKVSGRNCTFNTGIFALFLILLTVPCPSTVTLRKVWTQNEWLSFLLLPLSPSSLPHHSFPHFSFLLLKATHLLRANGNQIPLQISSASWSQKNKKPQFYCILDFPVSLFAIHLQI